MNKVIKKFSLLFMGLAMVLGAGLVGSETKTAMAAVDTPTSIGTGVVENSGQENCYITWTIDKVVTMVHSKGTGSKVYQGNNVNPVIYIGNILEFTAVEGYTIQKVEITIGNSSGKNHMLGVEVSTDNSVEDNKELFNYTEATTEGGVTVIEPLDDATGSHFYYQIKNKLTKTQGIKITYSAIFPSYKKVTTAPTDWTGTYIIVFEDNANNKAYSFNGKDIVKGHENVTIINETIVSSTSVPFYIETMEGGYSIKFNDNGVWKYISDTGTVGQNQIVFSEDPQLHTISMGTNGVAIKSSVMFLRFNNEANSLRFRYFAQTARQPIQLYKLVEAVTDTAETFTTDWLAMRGTAENDQFCAKLGTEEMDKLIARYDALEDKTGVAQEIVDAIEYARGVKNGTIQTSQGITPTSGATLVKSTNNSTSTYIVLSVILGLVTVSAYYFIERKRANR